MNNLKIFFLIGLFAIISCKDKSTNTDNTKIPSFSFETSKCISTASPSVLAKGSSISSDSIFAYSFTQNLILDFSAIGNCCPDSNRFTVSHDIRGDTIVITVIDTAQNLCHCNCLYMVHAQFIDLALDSYIVRCRLGNGQTFIDPTHLVTVVRNK